MSFPLQTPLDSLPVWARALLAGVSGALLPLALAPFNLWPLALAGLVCFALLLERCTTRSALLTAFAFGLGLYGAGVSWIYVSIHTYGGASALLAAVMTGLFVAFMALVFALPYLAYGRWFSGRAGSLIVAFSAFWLLGEWLRSWLLTGFPWLYLGYGHLDTWLAGWAPIAGVMGLGLILALTAGVIARWLSRPQVHRTTGIASALVVLFWVTGAGLSQVHWTQLRDTPITLGMVQPNIPQEVKWDPAHARPTLQLLEDMSEPLWQYDWVVWPEAAIPVTYHRALLFLDEINQHASNTDTGLISGIIYDELRERRYYNSVAGFGDAMGIYHKRRLVPFGEYVPLEEWLRGLIQFFDLPTSIISRGPEGQSGISIQGITLSPSICYEVVYPDLVARSARNAQVLLTISNDAWFADSIGPLQHMQMARMRSLETGRYLIRSTNNGVSALVDPKGNILARSEQFVAQTLTGEVYAADGLTPFMRWGSLPLAVIAFIMLAALRLRQHPSTPPPPLSDLTD